MGKVGENCLECKRKKQKCNRMRPQCHGCQISQTSCIYPEIVHKEPTARERYLEERLRQLEAAFRSTKTLITGSTPTKDEYSKPSLDVQNLHIDALIEEGGNEAETYALELLLKVSLVSPTAIILAKESSNMLKYSVRGFGFDFLGKTHLAELCLKKALQYFNETIENPSVVSVRALIALGMIHNRLNRTKEGFAYFLYGVKMAKDIGLNREESLSKICSGEFEKEECRKLWWHIYSVDQFLRYKNRSVLKDEDNGVFLPGSAGNNSSQDGSAYLGLSILSSSEWFTPPMPNQSIHSCKILLTRIFGKVLQFTHLYHHEGNKINVNYIHSVLEGSLHLWWQNLPLEFAEHLKILYSGAKIISNESWQVFETYLQFTYLKAEILLPLIFADIVENNPNVSTKHLTQLTIVAKESTNLLQTMLPRNSVRMHNNPLYGIPIFHLAIAIYCATLTDLPFELKRELNIALEVHLGCMRELLRLAAIKPFLLDTFDYLIALTDIKKLIKEFTKFKLLDPELNDHPSNFGSFSVHAQ
ncbi:Transcriptional activator [Boothiomyces sp. JEL0866]|nr:Transcriptional activator [Boothiomyces sp. JEL0866]